MSDRFLIQSIRSYATCLIIMEVLSKRPRLLPTIRNLVTINCVIVALSFRFASTECGMPRARVLRNGTVTATVCCNLVVTGYMIYENGGKLRMELVRLTTLAASYCRVIFLASERGKSRFLAIVDSLLRSIAWQFALFDVCTGPSSTCMYIFHSRIKTLDQISVLREI